MSPEFIAYAVPENGDELYAVLMQYYWQFTLNDRVVGGDFCAWFTDHMLNGAKAIRFIPEGSMRAWVLWFRVLYGDIDG